MFVGRHSSPLTLLLLAVLHIIDATHPQPEAFIVESVPQNMESLAPVPNVYPTADTLIKVVQNTSKTLDLTAMYWDLDPPVLPRCELHQKNCNDDAGFTKAQLDGMGAMSGRNLFKAIKEALDRGVHIRSINAGGFEKGSNPESDWLKSKYPDRYQTRDINMEDWYKGGVMHQKVWVSDAVRGYVGSANQDWKSFTQVKEIGFGFWDSPEIGLTVQQHFDVWWEFTGLNHTGMSRNVFDPDFHLERVVPCWSEIVPDGQGCQNPLKNAKLPSQANVKSPKPHPLNGYPGTFYMSCAPPETCVEQRTPDEKALVDTILSAKKWISISVMDFVPASLYSDIPIYWDALLRAVMVALNTVPGIQIRLLVSIWGHSPGLMLPYLESLVSLAEACQSDPFVPCQGNLEVKLFECPGFNSTIKPDRTFPGHSRVNHGKYIVTDQRANIGTSNMVWSYFYNTAGTSFNFNHTHLVDTLQQVFMRDWNSEYSGAFLDTKNKRMENKIHNVSHIRI
mmetsp:Transcript_6348/g.11704  ORF Transcript_6348/g.11704 Transcript_6348/m.11704 type:complete len:507 (-) Transcript_6348:317-1837(-)